MKLSDVLNAINHDKTPLLEDEQMEREYVPFVVNRSLSYFPDTILHANQMNFCNHLPKKMQFDYLRHSIRPRKRFSKWVKSTEEKNIGLVKEYFGYSNERAKEALRVLTEDQLKQIRLFFNYGG